MFFKFLLIQARREKLVVQAVQLTTSAVAMIDETNLINFEELSQYLTNRVFCILVMFSIHIVNMLTSFQHEMNS